MDACGGDTDTVAATADDTVIDAVATLPSDDANTNADPAPTAVTTPSADTLTTLGAPDVHTTTRCASAMPPASSATADSRTVEPIANDVDAGSIRSTAIGDGEALMVAMPVFPSLVTVMIAVPGDNTVTVPSVATRATLALLLANAIGRPVSRLPLLSVICTDNFSD